MAAVGSAFAIWPFIDSMNPSADVLALGVKNLIYRILRKDLLKQLNGEADLFLLNIEQKKKSMMQEEQI